MKKTLISISLAVILGTATVTSAAVKSEKAVSAQFTKGTNSKITAQVQTGFHINEKAPNRVTLNPHGQKISPSKMQKNEIEFDLPQDFKSGVAEVSIYVCDDAVTVCEERRWKWNADGTEAQATAPDLKKNGFILDALDVALKDCIESQKPLLLEFSARWCPGCMRMEKEVWTQPSMKSTLDKFIKVNLDADRFMNKPVMEKYSVAGIPTTLILNCEGEELERFVDFQIPAIFKSSLNQIAKNKKLIPRSELVAKAQAGDTHAALELAKKSALAGANKEALKWFGLTPTRENELLYWWAQTSELESSKDLAAFIKALKAAIHNFPNTPTSLDWRLKLAEQLDSTSPEGIEVLNSLVKLCEDLIKHPQQMATFNKSEFAGDYAGIESLKVYEARADALVTLKRETEAEQAWLAGVKEGERLGIKDQPNGTFFRYLIFLKKAKQTERLDKFFDKVLAKNPEDPELRRRYAQYLLDFGKYDLAAQNALISMSRSYDRNEIFAVHVYAKSLVKLNKTQEAKKLILKYLSRNDLPANSRADLESTLSRLK